jgi:hypothetical protein
LLCGKQHLATHQFRITFQVFAAGFLREKGAVGAFPETEWYVEIESIEHILAGSFQLVLVHHGITKFR